MKVIHAYRRKESTTVELFGLSIEFKPNDKKDVVAEVDNEEAVDRLLSIREAYRLYADQPRPLQVRDEAAGRLVNVIDARVTASAATTLPALQTSLAEAGAGLQINVDGTAEFPGVTVNGVYTKPADTDDAGQVVAQDQAQGNTGGAVSHYVFANEAGESIDISKWTAKEIRDFADSNEIELPKGNSVKVGELRDQLAAALAANSKE
ncbi:hypothetical protein [Pantoea sp. 18069]|uniref:hypothetical protein n=1 Tax=Pantoea sp. 18069 TaxID=2681415 RepID=UPI00135853E9|nr:hypothetical protein [Pantoea sp. 18069]